MKLIDRDSLKKELVDRQGFQDQKTACRFKEGYDCGLEAAIEDIDAAPIIDAVPVVHARWIKSVNADKQECSNCGEYMCGNWLTKYCHCCGAKMDKEAGHEAD